jgi:glycosyltransferase involved in cell wall biosynthesis
MSPARKLVTVSAYGLRGSSARVRIFDWLRILHLDAEKSTYLDRADNPLGALLGDLPAVVRAERRLRTLATSVGDATVLLSREASPFSLGAVESRLLRRSAHGVYDFDDALYAGYPGGLLSRSRHIDRVWRRSVAAADTVIAGNDTLASHASEYASHVVVIPSCVDPDEYLVKRSYTVPTVPTAVWLGSPSTEAQLAVAKEPLLALHRERGLRLTLISKGSRSHGELDAMIDRVDWSADRVADVLASADVGIMPLENDEWTRGKCAYKLLQYAAAGLPVIGSAVGVNVSVLDRLHGVAASSGPQWRDALHSVLEADDGERAKIGQGARSSVIEHYSYAAWADQWRAAIGI